MGNIDDAVPFFGRGFNRIYPLFMVVYTLLVASNFFGRLINFFGSWKRFKFQREEENMDGFDPSGMIILQKGNDWLDLSGWIPALSFSLDHILAFVLFLFFLLLAPSVHTGTFLISSQTKHNVYVTIQYTSLFIIEISGLSYHYHQYLCINTEKSGASTPFGSLKSMFRWSDLCTSPAERSWIEQGCKVGEQVIPLARNFNNVNTDVESGKVPLVRKDAYSAFTSLCYSIFQLPIVSGWIIFCRVTYWHFSFPFFYLHVVHRLKIHWRWNQELLPLELTEE